MKINPYLSFNGNCRDAFEFYEKCLGGKIVFIMTNGNSPMAAQTPADQLGRIMHVSMAVGDQILAGADAPPQFFSAAHGMCVSLDIATPAEAERIFNELSTDGQVQMPIQETFWAQRFAMFRDRFGTPWMINCSKPM